MLKEQVCVGADYLNRNGSKIDLQGIDLVNFIKNPVCLADHENECREVVGKWFPETWTIKQLNGNNFCFMDCRIDDKDIADKVDNGSLKGLSMGLFIKEWTIEESSTGGWFLKILKSELGEVSLCGIPAIPDAVIDNPMFNFSIGSQANDTKPKTSKISKEDFKAKVESELEKNKHYLKFNFNMSNTTQNTPKIDENTTIEQLRLMVGELENKNRFADEARLSLAKENSSLQDTIKDNTTEILQLKTQLKEIEDNNIAEMSILKTEHRKVIANLSKENQLLNLENKIFQVGSEVANTVLSASIVSDLKESFLKLHALNYENGTVYRPHKPTETIPANIAITEHVKTYLPTLMPTFKGNGYSSSQFTTAKQEEVERKKSYEAHRVLLTQTGYKPNSTEFNNRLREAGFGDFLITK